MQAVILAAGKGTRMRPLTYKTPKPLLKAFGKPLLQRTLENLPDAISEVFVIVGYKKEQIENYFGKKFGKIKINYIHQKETLGTGHAIQLCKGKIKGKFLSIMGDDMYAKKDLERCVKHRACALAAEIPDPSKFAAFVIDEKNRVLDVIEKPKEFISNLASVGVYVLTPKVFDYKLEKSERGEYELTDLVRMLCKEEEMYLEKTSFWMTVGTPEDLKKATAYFKKKEK